MTTQTFQTALWSRANQTAQPGVYLAELNQLRTPLPSFVEQKEVAVRLSSLKQNIEVEEGLRPPEPSVQ